MGTDRNNKEPAEAAERIIGIPRFTYSSWKSCYPGSSYEDYAAVQVPDNYIEMLAGMFGEADADFPGAVFKQVLIDDGYFKWLDGRPDSPEARADYTMACPPGEKEENAILARAGLNMSRWDYMIVSAVFLGKGIKNSMLRAETAESLKSYILSVLGADAADIYIGSFAVEPAAAISGCRRFADMADAWFNEGKNVMFGEYKTVSAEADNVASLLCTPVSVFERHTGNSMTVEEIGDYFRAASKGTKPSTGHPGRYLWAAYLSGDGAPLSPESMAASEAGKMFMEDIAGMGCGDDAGPPTLIRADMLEYHCRKLVQSLKRMSRRSGVKLKIV